MATKWRGWTARLPVKVCCVLLIPVMAFVFLCGVLNIGRATQGRGAYPGEGILFTDFSNNDYFFDTFALNAMSQVQIAFGYQSEEHIREMGCLVWEEEGYYDYSYENENNEKWLELVSVGLVNMRQTWGGVRASDLESPAAKRLVEGAINNQLYEYRSAREWLETMDGLLYYISDGKRTLTNTPDKDANFYRQQAVYIVETGNKWEQSREDPYSGWYWDNWSIAEERAVYIAFEKGAVDYRNSVWKWIQRQVAVNFSMMAVSALVALLSLLILMSGAGRRRADDDAGIHFTALDKLWLDFGLAVLICYEVALCSLAAYSIELAWRYNNLRWVLLLCAALSAAFTLPLLAWVLSLTKRCKAGKWWRYTLLYRLHDRFRRFLRSLWVGFPLTAKVVLISLAALSAMLLTAAAPPACLMFTAFVVAGLFRYAQRLHALVEGARSVGGGDYGTHIDVKGGELGAIADSVNRVSEGIGAAVTERMKSERFKTELITNVSHDIRTPLTSLITYTDLLKNEGLESENAPGYLEILIQKSARLKALTDDLFEASKAASGSIDVRLETIDLAAFVRQVLGELDERVESSGLDFRLNLPERAEVRADGRLLWRVMENLLSNVFKYALPGSRVYLDVTPENGGHRLEVKNISAEALNVDPLELTERFKRGDSARSDEGSGLGLSIAQSFVLAQGGHFTLSIDGDLFKAAVSLPGE